MNRYPKRLIEVDLPIARISAHARREKSIRHGHISTLHIWWARRPLAACRAVVCAALWPDPADDLCPHAFRETAVEQINQFAARVYPKKITGESKELQQHGSPESLGRWEAIAAGTLTLDANEQADLPILRLCLLDFIADFANWDNSTVRAYLETSRALTHTAHDALGGVPGTRPLVVDPFAGGGSIPLEALRIGADAFASDLNPVAVLLNKVVLEYIPKYGQRLADEVRKWGRWVKEQAEEELAEFYPKDSDGATPITYLWARTILSEAPGQGDIPVEVPMLRSMWLAKTGSQKKALRWLRDSAGEVRTEEQEVTFADGQTRTIRRPMFEIFSPPSEPAVEPGTVSRGAVTCPVTGFTTPVDRVRTQLRARRGGTDDARLISVVTLRRSEKGRYYRLPHEGDLKAVAVAKRFVEKQDADTPCDMSDFPNELICQNELRRISVPIYGMDRWRDLFTPRQLLAMSTLTKLVRRATARVREAPDCSEFAAAVGTLLSFNIGKQADMANSLCRWEPVAQCPRQLFGRQAIGMVWDFAEGVVTGESSGAYSIQVDRMEHVLRTMGANWDVGHAQQAGAATHPLPNDGADCVFTDPPYYDAVPYAHLSDFFYVWLRRCLDSTEVPFHDSVAVPKDEEIVVDRPHRLSKSKKGIKFYEKELTKAFAEARRVAQPNGLGAIVFASKTTASWEAILKAIVDAGWTITGSWPLDTEMENRVAAQGQARLASSVHLVCRPRENSDGSLREEIGEWRDVLTELPKRIHEWMPRLATEGVVGADAIFACLGPALEVFSRYSHVEKASGEAVPLREYLEHVWAAVSTEAMSMIFKDADAAGLEPDARLTAMWLWTLGTAAGNGNGSAPESDDKVVASTGYTLEFDAARKIAQGLGVHLEQSESIVEIKGDKARLLPASERTRYLFGKDEATATTARGRKKKKERQRSLFEELDELEAETVATGELKPQAGETVLDRVHQSMILFASGRGEALRRFLVDDGAGMDARFWKLAQSLSALYPKETDEKRWVDGVLARKKGLGL